jgi:hypothetical protein
MISPLLRTIRSALTVSAFALAATTAPAYAQVISLPDNELPTAGFGKGATTTFGQTFTAPTGFSFLQTFSFWLSNDPGLTTNSSSLLFQAYVMEWDSFNGHAVGPVLYTSGVQSGPTANSQRYNFDVTSIGLNPIAQYVAFLSASTQLSNIVPSDATAAMETSFLGTYTGGQFVFTTNGADFSSLSTDPWKFTGMPEYQSRFEATFSDAAVSVVPEPSSLMLLALGVLTVLLVVAKRKRA